jgi:hypothetical protein
MHRKRKTMTKEATQARPEDNQILDIAVELQRLAVMYGHYLSEAETTDDEDDAEEFQEAADGTLEEFLEELEKAAAWLKTEYDVGMEDEDEEEDEEEAVEEDEE